MTFNSIQIPVSPTILATYDTVANKGLFDSANSLFVLYNRPADFKFAPRENRSLSLGSVDTYVTRTIVSPIISITTNDGRQGIKDILEAIQEEANQLLFPIRDYQQPEASDANSFTVRQVVLRLIEPLGSTFNSSTLGNLGLGWRIEFQEDIRGFYG